MVLVEQIKVLAGIHTSAIDSLPTTYHTEVLGYMAVNHFQSEFKMI